jgi:hypothetical protein
LLKVALLLPPLTSKSCKRSQSHTKVKISVAIIILLLCASTFYSSECYHKNQQIYADLFLLLKLTSEYQKSQVFEWLRPERKSNGLVFRLSKQNWPPTPFGNRTKLLFG